MKSRKKVLGVLMLLMFAMVGSKINAQKLEEGIALMDKEEYPQARALFRQMLAQNPKSSDVYFYLGQSYYDNERIDSAKYYYNKGIEMDPKGSLSYVGTGKLALDDKNPTAAEGQFKLAEKYASKKDWRSLYEIGNAYLDSKNPDANKALSYLNRADEISLKNPDIFASRGDAYDMLKDAGKAMTNYESAINFGKSDIKNYLKMAKIWKQARNYNKAIETLNEAVKIDPSYTPAYKDLIEAYILNNQYNKVTPLLEKYIGMVPNDIESKARFVRFLVYQARDNKRAVNEANAILAKDSNQVAMYRWLGYAFYEDSLYQESFDNMQKFLAKAGDIKIYPADYKYLAKAALKIQKNDVAMEAFNKLGELGGEGADAASYDEIAKSFYEVKDYAKALEFYKKKTALQEASVQDLYYIALCQFGLQEYTASDSTWTAIIEKSPSYTLAYVYRARAHANLDPELKQALAKPFYEKVIEIAAVDTVKNARYLVEAYNYMAYYYITQSDNATAISYFEKVVALDPTNQDAISNIDYLKSGGKKK